MPRYAGVVQGAIAPSRSVFDGSGTIRAEVEVDHPAEPLAGRAGPERAVVAEQPRVGLGVVAPAAAASPALVEGQVAASSTSTRHRPSPLANAVSIESSRRPAASEPRTRRSTTTSTAALGRHRAAGPSSEPDDLAADADPGEPVLAERVGQRRRGRTRGGRRAGRRSGSASARAGRRSPATTVAGVGRLDRRARSSSR